MLDSTTRALAAFATVARCVRKFSENGFCGALTSGPNDSAASAARAVVNPRRRFPWSGFPEWVGEFMGLKLG